MQVRAVPSLAPRCLPLQLGITISWRTHDIPNSHFDLAIIYIVLFLYPPSIIMDFQQFMDTGEKLKLEGKELLSFVERELEKLRLKEEAIAAREERAAERQVAKDAAERQVAKDAVEAERQVAKDAAERQVAKDEAERQVAKDAAERQVAKDAVEAERQVAKTRLSVRSRKTQ